MLWRYESVVTLHLPIGVPLISLIVLLVLVGLVTLLALLLGNRVSCQTIVYLYTLFFLLFFLEAGGVLRLQPLKLLGTLTAVVICLRVSVAILNRVSELNEPPFLL